MTRDEWHRVKEIAAGALAENAAARASYLAVQCGEDSSLLAEVESLLTATAEAADLYEEPALLISGARVTLEAIGSLPPSDRAADALVTAEPAATLVGRRIGSYRIVSELGRGGMGAVFLAERDDDEYRQRVALKVAHRARSQAALRWFRAERQILASLEHPHIARLLDGGTTADGVPYLVMEYVEGKPIDDYCFASALTIDQRLKVFRQVCAAVEYAHRSLIVHRDLKPRNIVVANGQAKLLDFGIAKLLGDADHEDSPDDEPGANTAGIMTPEYASPEQIRGGPVTAATDVFALGVLLYRLLTNRSPYRVSASDPHAVAAAVCEQEATPPSAVADSRQARRRLAGDLDAIVLKAIQKAPAARYATVAQLIDDVDRHLSALPVAARPHAPLYRAGRFVVRHKLAVTAAALLLVTLIGGLGATLWQARRAEQQRARAERHFNDVRRLASSLIFEVHDGIENLPGSIATRQLLITRAVDYFDGLASQEQDNPALQRELASAYDKLAGVLGRPYASNLGDTQAALANYRKALAIREALARDSRDRQTQLDLWSSYYNVGAILRETADTEGALAFHGRAHEIVSGLLTAAADDPVLLKAAARTAVTRAHTFEQAGQVAAALASAREALSLDEGLLARDATNNLLRSDVATDHGRIGIALLRLGDPQTALQHMGQRVALAERLTAAEPANVAFRRGLSTARLQLGQALARNGDAAGAVREQLVALEVRRSLAAQNPDDRQAQVDLMFAHLELGQAFVRAGDLARAANELRAAVASCETLAQADPNYVFYQLSLASALTRLSSVLSASGRPDDGQRLAQRAVALMESSSRADPSDARLRFEIALAYEAIGNAAAASAQRETAVTWYERSLAEMERLRAAGTLAGGTMLGDEAAKMADIRLKIARART